MAMISNSYAKINLAINIIKRNDDGYHEVDMITSKIKFYDEIEIKINRSKRINLSCSNRFISCDAQNLVYQAAHLVMVKYKLNTGLDIAIKKRIPIQAGLGGGSSNAATTIEMLNKMFNLKMTLEDKVSLGKELGSDIPLFFYADVCRIQGYGEKVTPVKNHLKDISIILVKPNFGLATRDVYQNVNLSTCDHPAIAPLVKALGAGDYPSFIKNTANSLQESALKIKPAISSIMTELYELGIDKCLVCGSGSTVVGFTKKPVVAKTIKQYYLKKKFFVFITKMI